MKASLTTVLLLFHLLLQAQPPTPPEGYQWKINEKFSDEFNTKKLDASKWHAWGKNPSEIFDSLGSIQPGKLKTYNSQAGHITDIAGNEAVTFLNKHISEEPFFLCVGFNAPHVPRQTTRHVVEGAEGTGHL